MGRPFSVSSTTDVASRKLKTFVADVEDGTSRRVGAAALALWFEIAEVSVLLGGAGSMRNATAHYGTDQNRVVLGNMASKHDAVLRVIKEKRGTIDCLEWVRSVASLDASRPRAGALAIQSMQ